MAGQARACPAIYSNQICNRDAIEPRTSLLLNRHPLTAFVYIEDWAGGRAFAGSITSDGAGQALIVTGGAHGCNQRSAWDVQLATTGDSYALSGFDQNSHGVIGGPSVGRELASGLAIGGQVSSIELRLGC